MRCLFTPGVGATRGWRQLFDTVFTVTPSSTFSAYINYDYGQNGNLRPYPTTTFLGFSF